MAVTKQKIEDRFKILFPGLNLSKARMDAIADILAPKPADDADDATVDAVLNEANGYFPFSEVAKSDDRVRNAEALLEKAKTPEQVAAELEAKRLADEKKARDLEALNEAPSWAKTFMEGVESKFAEIGSKVAQIESGTVKTSKQATAAEAFAKSETLKALAGPTKDRWLGRINVDSETPIEDQIKELEAEYTELVQISADGRPLAGVPPVNSLADSKMTDAEADKLAMDLLPGLNA